MEYYTNMPADPKQRFKQYVGAESGGGRPIGQGFITERQRLNLNPAYLDYLEEALSKKGRRRQVVRRQAETARQAQGQTGSRKEPKTTGQEEQTQVQELGCPICGSALCLTLGEEEW